MKSEFPAPAKLNLFLHVTGRRADGYHLLESVFQLVDFGDTISISVRPDGDIRRGNEIAGLPAESDLAVRAARLLQQAAGVREGADLSIVKRIPMGGGLGGGSSDAATVLLALNRMWKIDWSRTRLMELGLALGADVPFFLFGRNAFGSGIGEQLAPVDLPEIWFVVLTPQVSVPTAEVFGSPELTRNAKSVKMLDFSADVHADGGLGAMAGHAWFSEPAFRNDLQPVVVVKYPAVGEMLAWLGRVGRNALISARMTGSGACVFAGFADRLSAEQVFAQRPADAGGFVASGLKQHPLIDCAS